MTIFYACANFLWSKRKFYVLAKKLPGPKGLPLIGEAHRLIGANHRDIFKVFVNFTAGYESPAKVWLGPMLLVVVDSPETIKTVLQSQNCINKSSLYDLLVLTKGLLINGGDVWRVHRKILNPSFYFNVLKDYIPIFDEKSRILVNNLECKVGSGEINAFDYLSACSLETILKTTMNLNRDIQSNPIGHKYIHDIEM